MNAFTTTRVCTWNQNHQECYKMKRVYSVLVTVRGETEMSQLLLFLDIWKEGMLSESVTPFCVSRKIQTFFVMLQFFTDNRSSLHNNWLHDTCGYSLSSICLPINVIVLTETQLHYPHFYSLITTKIQLECSLSYQVSNSFPTIWQLLLIAF